MPADVGLWRHEYTRAEHMSREAEESARTVSIWEKVFKQAYQRARCKPPCCSERSSQHQPIQLHASHGVPIALIHKCINQTSGTSVLPNALELRDETGVAALVAARCVPRARRRAAEPVQRREHSSLLRRTACTLTNLTTPVHVGTCETGRFVLLPKL